MPSRNTPANRTQTSARKSQVRRTRNRWSTKARAMARTVPAVATYRYWYGISSSMRGILESPFGLWARHLAVPTLKPPGRAGITPTERGTVMTHHVRTRLVAAVAGVAIAVIAQGPAGASTSLTISGSSSTVGQKPLLGRCSIAGECGTIVLDGLGVADWGYVFGPTFDPVGRCYREDGTFTITLRSDGSTISGPLTGTFCPKPGAANQ